MAKKKQPNLFTEPPQVLSVFDYISLVNSNLEVLSDIAIEGEVSEFKVSQEKWVTFRLKDEKEEASIECFTVIFKLNQPVEDGMKIRVIGRPRIYPRYGKFSISVENIELTGEGSLKRAFELTKQKLQVEGLFDEERKRPIPEFPKTIGLITSPDAAAYTDFLKVLKHRFGGIKIYFFSARVQGKGAVEDIVEGFDWFNQNYKKLDIQLVVLTRGGGALEDLQAFNSEGVARAVFSSKIPVVCGVGHERDESLVDFVADLRASTPSNAAELITRGRDEVGAEIEGIIQNIEYLLKHSLEEKQSFLNHFLSNCSHFISEKTYETKQILVTFFHRIETIGSVIFQKKQEIGFILTNVEKSIKNHLGTFNRTVSQQESLLKSYNPLGVLKRGYGIVRNKNGKIIKSTKDILIGDDVETVIRDGNFISKVQTIKPTNS
ncbi:MAG: exodeoxyribonuclease VII large subunit [Candidatus Paceibacterota bacterium]|jgi:exodeoxyribonuclease VII large subunit